MGIFAFLTAGRLKTELTRQRDEIARLHQMLDIEVAVKQEAEKEVHTSSQEREAVEQKLAAVHDELKAQERKLQEEQNRIQQELDQERKKVQEEADKTIHDMEDTAVHLASGTRRTAAATVTGDGTKRKASRESG